jgi:hypothetical protein
LFPHAFCVLGGLKAKTIMLPEELSSNSYLIIGACILAVLIAFLLPKFTTSKSNATVQDAKSKSTTEKPAGAII